MRRNNTLTNKTNISHPKAIAFREENSQIIKQLEIMFNTIKTYYKKICRADFQYLASNFFLSHFLSHSGWKNHRKSKFSY